MQHSKYAKYTQVNPNICLYKMYLKIISSQQDKWILKLSKMFRQTNVFGRCDKWQSDNIERDVKEGPTCISGGYKS